MGPGNGDSTWQLHFCFADYCRLNHFGRLPHDQNAFQFLIFPHGEVTQGQQRRPCRQSEDSGTQVQRPVRSRLTHGDRRQCSDTARHDHLRENSLQIARHRPALTTRLHAIRIREIDPATENRMTAHFSHGPMSRKSPGGTDARPPLRPNSTTSESSS